MDLSDSAQYWVNLVLLWIGFGTVVGLFANILLPEGNPKGFFGVLVIGITGSCIGPALVTHFRKPESFQPISPLGFAVSLLAALILFLTYRLFLSMFKRQEKEKTES